MNIRIILVFGALATLPIVARPKIDVVVMTNGDRLTCEIKKLDRGVLYIGLDYVDGTLSVDWSKVERLDSKQLFRVETAAGITYSGTLRMVASAADQPRSIEVLEDQTPNLRARPPIYARQRSDTYSKENVVEVIDWPPYSPDLNPIEYTWVQLKERLHKMFPYIARMHGSKEKVIKEPSRAIAICRSKITPSFFESLITSMHEVYGCQGRRRVVHKI